MAKNSTIVLVAMIGGLGLAPAASAQPLGSFVGSCSRIATSSRSRSCSRVARYQLDGTDDQCGAAQAASVRGMAFQNLNGTIGFGLTIVTAPGGTPVHVDATLTFPGLNGTWRDSAGNTGNLIFGAGIPARRTTPRADGRPCARQCHDHSDRAGRRDQHADCGECRHGREHRQRQRDDGGPGGAASPGGYLSRPSSTVDFDRRAVGSSGP